MDTLKTPTKAKLTRDRTHAKKRSPRGTRKGGPSAAKSDNLLQVSTDTGDG
jgi:hypothetical protein